MKILPEFWEMIRLKGLSFVILTIIAVVFGCLYYNSIQDTVAFRKSTKAEFTQLYKNQNKCNEKIINLLETTIQENTQLNQRMIQELGLQKEKEKEKEKKN